MSYELLRGLYLGAASNADTTGRDAREMLHVRTELDNLVPRMVQDGLDVVITGNPGDGKSHLVRTLEDRGKLPGAEIELDLSAADEREVLERWRAARAGSRPFLLCGNEGPLKSLLAAMRGDGPMSDTARELSGQLGRLVASSDAELPPRPTRAVLVDLADRSVLDPGLIQDALRQVCLLDFIPAVPRGRETSAGRNVMLLSSSMDAAGRLATLLAAAGRRRSDHVSFRQLWAAISFAVCAGKATSTMLGEISRMEDELGYSPIDNLAKEHGQGALLRAFRELADPAAWPHPQLDEDIWSNGAPVSGEWEVDVGPFEAPSVLWAAGQTDVALDKFRSIKRLVALFHSAGQSLVDAIAAGDRDLPSAAPDGQLLQDLLRGVRRVYLDPSEEEAAPEWLQRGVPLWVSHTYQDVPASQRPHVAVACLPPSDFSLRRARRPSWLQNALGPPPELVWVVHDPSGIALRIDPQLLSALRRAGAGSGPIEPPDPVRRFLDRLSGWEERRGGTDVPMAVLEHPRGGLLATGRVAKAEGLSYRGDDAR
jgi:hypothetical protein